MKTRISFQQSYTFFLHTLKWLSCSSQNQKDLHILALHFLHVRQKKWIENSVQHRHKLFVSVI